MGPRGDDDQAWERDDHDATGGVLVSRVIYIGNFVPEHSTENHVLQALQANGHHVMALQEDDVDSWRYVASRVHSSVIATNDHPEVVMWTRTKSLSDQIDDGLKRAVLHACYLARVPTVGYHLDRWWGLARESEILAGDPFFQVAALVTADGGHDKEWADAGVNHLWMPPGVSEFECVPGTFDEAYASDIAFVGSWQGGYHHEWPHRDQLVGWLMATYGDRCRFWPQQGQPAVRGPALRDLYASVKVVVGDSCLVPNRDGSPVARYWSDRVPETLGRGGVLVHPWVEGMPFIGGAHLFYWQLGDWDTLRSLIDYAVEMSDESRALIRETARQRILNGDTYTVGMRELWDHLGL